jgi:hypothetical protein
MTSKLPLFPLELVLLPYETLPLHIFEPRYKAMVKNSIEDDMPFGIVLKEGDELFPKGCKVKVTKVFKEYDSGKYDIMVKGLDCFDVIGTEMIGDTVIGKIQYIPMNLDADQLLIQELQDSYLKVILRFGIKSDLEVHMNKKISFEFLQGLQLPVSIKKDLIEMDSELSRLAFINTIFNNILSQPFKSENGHIPEA